MSKGNIDLSILSSIKDERYISLKDCLEGVDLNKYEIPMCLGKDSDKNIIIKDFKDIGNLLICGATSSGKSVFINSFINTILLSKTPEEVKFIMIDPKMIELITYNGIENLLYPICEDLEKGFQLIEWCKEEIKRRGEENIKKPYIVLVIDEFADLMLCDDRANTMLEKIASKGSAVGIHMILSSSKPSGEVFTTELKNVIPTRLVGALVTSIDSKEIIEEESGVDLIGSGDMIFINVKSGEKIRVQTPFISTEDQEIVVSSIPKTRGFHKIETEKFEEEIDPLYEDAKRLTIESRKASASFLQRKLVISYIRASKLIDALEREGVISGTIGSKPREVLIDRY